jgi:hypothetical protein
MGQPFFAVDEGLSAASPRTLFSEKEGRAGIRGFPPFAGRSEGWGNHSLLGQVFKPSPDAKNRDQEIGNRE